MTKHSHTLITLAVVLAASLFGAQWPAALAMAAFWAGREHAQAEYRWMARYYTNRAGMPWYAGWLPESWTRDSLVNDLLLPAGVGLLIAWLTGFL